MSDYAPTVLVVSPRVALALHALNAGLLSLADSLRDLAETVPEPWTWVEGANDWRPEPLPLSPGEGYTVPVYDNGLRWEAPACRVPPHRRDMRPGERVRRKAKRKQQRKARRRNR